MRSVIALLIFLTLIPTFTLAGPTSGPGEWTEIQSLQSELRNPFHYGNTELLDQIYNGRFFAVNYPIRVTGSAYPYGLIDRLFYSDHPNFLLASTRRVLKLMNISDMNSLGKYLGLNKFPGDQYAFPRSDYYRVGDRLAIARFKKNNKEVFTLSCLACHSGTLFGKVVLGLSNRYPRANEAFSFAHQVMQDVPSSLVQWVTKIDDADLKLYHQAVHNSYSIAAIKPTAPGLEIPLAQVALSLDRRKLSPWAEGDVNSARHPRANIINSLVTDTKPAVWWNVRYKTKWLLDGSIVGGNPLMSIVLMNEIGRGTDLRALDKWIESHPNAVKALTTAVLNTEAPRITEFFNPKRISIERAKRGEVLFNQTCKGCHGQYQKNWSLVHFKNSPIEEQIKTSSVNYHWGKGTPVKDVGTDPDRYLAIKGLESNYNQLALSKKYGLKLKTQKGYVPPPLVGIWARWPYFHNNSAPNLCSVLTPAAKRTMGFFMGPANDPEKDFDFDCVGYPLGKKTPKKWMTSGKMFFDATQKGLTNQGHEKMLLKDGKEKFSPQDKKDLIEFLKTL